MEVYKVIVFKKINELKTFFKIKQNKFSKFCLDQGKYFQTHVSEIGFLRQNSL